MRSTQKHMERKNAEIPDNSKVQRSCSLFDSNTLNTSKKNVAISKNNCNLGKAATEVLYSLDNKGDWTIP